MAGLLILAVWLYDALVLAERRSGLLLLLASILGVGVPILHMTGAGLVGGRIAHSSGVFFTLGALAMFSFFLSVHELWALRRRPV